MRLRIQFQRRVDVMEVNGKWSKTLQTFVPSRLLEATPRGLYFLIGMGAGEGFFFFFRVVCFKIRALIPATKDKSKAQLYLQKPCPVNKPALMERAG